MGVGLRRLYTAVRRCLSKVQARAKPLKLKLFLFSTATYLSISSHSTAPADPMLFCMIPALFIFTPTFKPNYLLGRKHGVEEAGARFFAHLELAKNKARLRLRARHKSTTRAAARVSIAAWYFPKHGMR